MPDARMSAIIFSSVEALPFARTRDIRMERSAVVSVSTSRMKSLAESEFLQLRVEDEAKFQQCELPVSPKCLSALHEDGPRIPRHAC